MREHNQTIRSRLARALRWAIEKLGGESDTELHARVLGVYARSAVVGTRESYERAILDVTPLAFDLEFIWDGPVCRGDVTQLTVIFR